MSSTVWDPQQYAKFAGHRDRPFFDLLSRVGAGAPGVVVDLGCGNGPLTLSLARRWPDATVIGVDSSAEMIARARELDTDGRVEWVHADLGSWQADTAVDVMVTNAALQWVPGHLDLLPRLLGQVAAGGWFAMQVPGNFDAPSHALLREVAARMPRADELVPRLRGATTVGEPPAYAEVLADAGFGADVWETTYLQMLDPQGQQSDPVLEWTKGTAMRPVLEILTGEAERAEFLEAYAAELRRAYPRGRHGTAFPFRRIFAVGHRDEAGGGAPAARTGHGPGHAHFPTKAPVTGLHHVQVSCPAGAEDELRGFYAGVLGMAEVPKPPVLAARGGVWFRSGRAEVHCGVEEDFRPARKAHPCLLVTDVDAVAEAVAAAGGQVRWDDNIPGVRRFHTDDPVGNRIELQQA